MKVVTPTGNVFYYKDGEGTILHRDDGPAVISSDGKFEAWYCDGVRHREDGPAVTYCDGKTEWWFHGYKSRLVSIES